MERMGSVPNLPLKLSVSIGTMLNVEGDEHGDGTCKQALTNISNLRESMMKISFGENTCSDPAYGN